MQAIQGFSLETHQGEYEQWPKTTALLLQGRATGARIPGYRIEAQYRCRNGYLLVTSYDCPFEESNSFVLLDEQFQELGQALLGVMYGSFLLHAHWPLDADTLQLHYEMRQFYRLQIRPPRTWLRRHPTLKLSRDDLALAQDARARASVEALELLREAQRVDAIVDPVPVPVQDLQDHPIRTPDRDRR